jgi:hypothetical protein
MGRRTRRAVAQRVTVRRGLGRYDDEDDINAPLRQTARHRVEQGLNGLHRFVPHIRNPETFAFDLSVAAIDLETELVPQLFGKLRDIDLSIIAYAGQSHRAKTLLCEKLKPVLFYPFMDDGIRFAMPAVPVL